MMYRGLMLLIVVLYFGAFVAAAFERKWLWSIVFLGWAVGGLAMYLISRGDQ